MNYLITKFKEYNFLQTTKHKINFNEIQKITMSEYNKLSDVVMCIKEGVYNYYLQEKIVDYINISKKLHDIIKKKYKF